MKFFAEGLFLASNSVNAVMGGDYWLGIVTDPRLDKIQREDLVVGRYMERLREFFGYTYSVPVKELVDDPAGSVPTDDLAKYHLIFGTRSPRAVVYMNDIAINALEPYFSQFKDGLLFDMTPGRYEPCVIDEVKQAIIEAVAALSYYKIKKDDDNKEDTLYKMAAT